MNIYKSVWNIIIILFIFISFTFSNVIGDKEPNNSNEEAELIFEGVYFGNVDEDDIYDNYKFKVLDETIIFIDFTTTSGVGVITMKVNDEEIKSLKSHEDTLKFAYFASNESMVNINITCFTNYTTEIYLTNYNIRISFESLREESFSNLTRIALIIVMILIVTGILIIIFDLKKRKKLKTEYFESIKNFPETQEETAINFQINPIEFIGKLGELKDKGYITEEEFQKKKEELLKRV